VKIRTAWAVPALALPVLLAAPARAFSDPALFAAPATDGGGAGRYFTGSPADGHACGACHLGGATPRISFEGFPDAIEPWARYDVTLRWDPHDASHALHLELMNAAGEHPSVELSIADDLPPEARCEGEPDGAPAVYAVDAGARRVLGVQDCGARALAFSFVAPAEPLFFAIGAVRSDSSATPEGDGVLEQRRVIGSGAEPGGACAIWAPSRGRAGCVAGLAALLVPLALRRRTPSARRRRSE
jgi:hypothetical protein